MVNQNNNSDKENETKAANSRIFKFVIFIFIPFYLAIGYFVYNYQMERILEVKTQRESIISEINSIEQKIKREAAKTPSTKKNYKQVNANTRLSSEIKEINKEINSMITLLDLTKSRFDEKLERELASKTYEALERNKKYENVVPELNIIKASEVRVVGEGPTSDHEVNEQIKKTMELRNQLKESLDGIMNDLPECQRNTEESMKVFDKDSEKFSELRNTQWDVLNKISLLENELEVIKKEMNELETSMDISVDALINNSDSNINNNDELFNSEAFNSLSLSELNNYIETQEEIISKYPETILRAQENSSNHDETNFINTKDFNTLSSYFNKKISYKKLISSHEKISKQKFDSRVSNRSNLFIYLELSTERRVGIYINMKFPKTTRFSKAYKDENGFIAYFNKKEFYPAKKDQTQHIRTDNDFFLLVGNVKDGAGIWLREEGDEENKNLITASLGYPTTQYDCLKGSLFSNPYKDIVVGFEVYELVFDETDSKENKTNQDL